MKAKRDPLAFATATLELHLLRRLADAHYLDLYYFDESRFTLVSNVPRAWQAPGEPVALTATRGPGVNVAGFLRYDGTDLHAYTSEQNLNSEDVIGFSMTFASTAPSRRWWSSTTLPPIGRPPSAPASPTGKRPD